MDSCVPRSPNKICATLPVTSKRAPETHINCLISSASLELLVFYKVIMGEFVNSVITEFSAMWDGLKMVNGKPRHSQSQGSVERANRDIENMLMTWLQSNSTTHWGDGLRFIQVMKNRVSNNKKPLIF